MKYKGTIVLESLADELVLNDLDVNGLKITADENPQDRWHLVTVSATEEQIRKLSDSLKPEKWYAHFWNGDDVLAVFPGKVFRFKHSDKNTWKEAVEYGRSLGIPEKQLDFLISE